MEDNGWIKLWRQFYKWEWFDDSHTVHLFIFLLLRASHKNTRYRGFEIRRGQVVFGLNATSKITKISVRSIRTSLNRLISTGEVTRRTTNQFSIITLCNYDAYQSTDNKNDIQNDSQTAFQTTSNRQASDNIQEYKNVRSKEVVSSKPTLLECKDYFKELLIPLEAEKFFDHFESNGWRVGGKAPMKNWKAAARNWKRRNGGKNEKTERERDFPIEAHFGNVTNSPRHD